MAEVGPPHKHFLEAVQARIARSAAGPSPTRGQGRGVSAAAQAYLRELPLRPFGTAKQTLFQQRLDDATEQLRLALPEIGRSWGVARKVINILLRDALYRTYLADEFQIQKAERFLEVPLDSFTARWLRKRAGRGQLPRWRGIKHLTPEQSAAFQAFASTYAATKHPSLARVHLDTYSWGMRDAHIRERDHWEP